MDYQTYYASIEKPFFAPEPWVFGLAWGIIYPLIAIAFIYAIHLAHKRDLSWSIIGLFAVNMAANFAFTPLQLQYPSEIYATLDIVLVVGTLAVLEYVFWKRNKLLFVLLFPYLAWGVFATVLQLTIFVTNF